MEKMMRFMRLSIVMLCVMMIAAPAAAQRKKSSKKKTRVTKVVQPAKDASITIESLYGKAFVGVIGQTVVDFFGTRKTYGNVTQELYIYNDKQVILRQVAGYDEVFEAKPYEYDAGVLKVGDCTYHVTRDALHLLPMKQNGENREGKLETTVADNILNLTFQHGKHLSGMTIQTDEDKQNAHTFLTIASDKDVKGARDYFRTYNEKRAESGDKGAIEYMLREAIEAKDYKKAHECIDKLIQQNPDNMDLLCDKGNLHLMENKASAAKKIWKKLSKKDANFTKTSQHTFCSRMRQGK